ncbi:MAG TPA: phytanoyl-CoA dioxygenase family protein [Tepidisphaeraceae bacterium]|nr:phytanoyl-CoA dioxygenase family protein [Tepidisphaeraceae bacterium]
MAAGRSTSEQQLWSATGEALSQRYRVTVEQYRAFHRDGFLVVRGLVPPQDIAELRQHTEKLMQGQLPEQLGRQMPDRDVSRDGGVTVQGLESPPAHLSPAEKAQYFLRIHMLHRRLELHERYLLHPRVLDVLEVLIGPDVLALQTMLFLKPPGKPGQGWHQDSYYIPTHPDTLCGAWIAIDDCDELNGAMWFAKGSQVEPIYPPCPDAGYGFGQKLISDIMHVKGVSEPDDQRNMLSLVADRYDQVLVWARAGDVVFFGGHVLHRSKANFTTDRFRRAFVGHYCNARSFTQWGADTEPGDPHASSRIDPVTKMTNGSHILARGDTHLPFAQPRFGTPCAALLLREQRAHESEYVARVIASMNHGLLGCGITDPTVSENHY